MTDPAAGTKSAAADAVGRSTVVSIQYLRAIAAGIVVYHHAFAPPALNAYYPSQVGQFGVDIFFVISGFIMWTTTVGGDRSPFSFWVARIVRVVPLYWLYTALFLVTAVVVTGKTADIEPGYVLKSFLFVPENNPQTNFIVPVYSLGWTLNFEMFFYLLFGLSLLLPSRSTRYGALMLAFLSLMWAGHVLHPQQPVLLTYTSPMLLDFLEGVTLAVLSRFVAGCAVWIGLATVLLGVAAFYFSLPIGTVDNVPVSYGVPAMLLVGGAVLLEPLAHRHPSRIGLLLGNASYSMYLAHPFAQRLWYLAMFHYFPAVTSAVQVSVVVGVAMVLGIFAGVASWLFFERPFLAVAHRIMGRGQPVQLDLTARA